jgi:hypothetical protein
LVRRESDMEGKRRITRKLESFGKFGKQRKRRKRC